MIFSQLYGVPREKRRTTINRLLDAVELTEWRDKQVMYLSGGMRQADRLCDRIAIVDHGKLVALDSPANLKASIPGTNVTLDDVFVHFTGNDLRDGLQERVTRDFSHVTMRGR